ncbi:unnamed protein product [Rotaria sp. Silwood1]|nr:unnamed protein product [Rotaria sp. Silwood1]
MQEDDKTTLSYPFALMLNSQTGRLNHDMNILIDQYTMLPEEQRRKYKTAGLSWGISTLFPRAKYDQLLLCSRYIVFLFTLDDYYCSFSFEEINSIFNDFEQILNGRQMPIENDPTQKQLFQLRHELLPQVTSDWMQRFINDLRFHFDGMLMEYQYDGYPSITEYVNIRERLSACDSLQDLIELQCGFFFSEKVMQHPFMKRLRQLTRRMTGFCNDFYSWPKELKHGEKMNLILIIQHEMKCSIDQAICEAVRMHDDHLKEFIQLADQVNTLEFDSQNRAALIKYIDHLKLFIQGHHAWHSHSRRFKNE